MFIRIDRINVRLFFFGGSVEIAGESKKFKIFLVLIKISSGMDGFAREAMGAF